LWLVLRSIHPVTICLPIKKRPSTILPIDRDVTLMNFRSSKLFPVTRWRSVMDKRWLWVTASRMSVFLQRL